MQRNFVKSVIVSTLLLVAVSTVILQAAAVAQDRVELSLSHPSGFYTQDLELSVSSSVDGVEIRYSLNGDSPGLDSPILIESLLISDRHGDPDNYSTIESTTNTWAGWRPPQSEVFKATVFRARAFRDDEPVSDVYTATYIVDPLGAHRYSLPVISLVSDSVNWFGYEEGIYVLGHVFTNWSHENPEEYIDGSTPANWHGRGREWERPVHIEFFERDGRPVFATDAGVRIHGGWSRAFQQKSLRLYSRSEYGDSRFRYRFFSEKTVDNFNRLILRNSGNDWGGTMMRDAFMQQVVAHIGLDYQGYLPVIVFLNGEYWGIHNIRERIDRHYLAANHNLDGDNVDLLTHNAEIKEGDDEHYRSMIEYLEMHGVQEQEHYEYVQTLMDIDNFIDYNILQIFFRNTDWPHNNVDFWRYRTEYDPRAPAPMDGRWRWIVFDLDFGFGLTGQPSAFRHYTLRWATSPTGNDRGAWSTLLLRTLLENTSFRNRFISRFADHLNTTFDSERMFAILDGMQEALAPDIPEHLQRWGSISGWRPPANVDSWNARVNVMRQFAGQRPTHQRAHLMEFFELSDTIHVSISVNDAGAGAVRVNTVELRDGTQGLNGFPWQGTYFEDVPLTVEAVPAAGYRFVEWQGSVPSTDRILRLRPSETVALYAVFEQHKTTDHEPPPHVLAEGPYTFSHWDATEPAGSFPPSMRFFYMDRIEPGLDAEPAGVTSGRYDDDSRTRIVGLGEAGFAFINTSNLDGNPGYPGRRLGAAAVALDTRGQHGLNVQWLGGTVLPNSRVYNIRLQYRIGDDGPLYDVVDDAGNAVEYERNEQAGHAEVMGPVRLPDIVSDRPYVQLWWRYYYTGRRELDDDGSRAMMRVSDILISAETSVSVAPDGENLHHFRLHPNYPNPFADATTIRFNLPKSGPVELSVYNVIGQRVRTLVSEIRNAGMHSVMFEGSDLGAGVYIYRLSAGDHEAMEIMQIVR